MIKKIFFIFVFLPLNVIAVEISETNSLIEGETIYYSQASSGKLSACGFEFRGADKGLNLFVGSIGFLYFSKTKKITPLFKIKSYTFNLDGSKKLNLISNAWIQTKGGEIIGKNWIRKNSKDSFLLIGASNEAFKESALIWSEIAEGHAVKIGFLHKGGSIDRVYRLKKYQQKKEFKALVCLSQLLKQLEIE